MKVPRLLIENLPEEEAKKLANYNGVVFTQMAELVLSDKEKAHIALLAGGILLIDRQYMGTPEIQSAIIEINNALPELGGFPHALEHIYLADSDLVNKINKFTP